MRQVSEAFKAKIKDPQRVEHVRGNVGGVSFEDKNIIHLAYQNQCSDNKDVTFGSARIGQLTATFWGLNIPRYSWRELPIKLDYGLEIDDEGTVEWVDDLLTATIAKAEWTDSGMNVTAYDCLSQFDSPIEFEQTYGEVYDMLLQTGQAVGVDLGITKSQCEALPNGNENLGLMPQNGITTYRDFLSSIATVIGGFATATGDGKLTIRSFADSEVVFSFEAKDRVNGSVFSDYITNYAGIVIEDSDSNSNMYYYAEGAEDGIFINIGENPLLQYGLTETKLRQRQQLAEVAHSIAYVPFKMSILNCPVFELGDLIECEGGIAGNDTVTCCVMSIDWTFKAITSMQGFGADPNLTAGKSRTDKALTQAMSKVSENEVVTHTFINVSPYQLDDDVMVSIFRIRFTTIKPKVVTIAGEINLNLDITAASGIATATAYYYLNGVLEEYQPIDSWDNDGMHLLHLFNFLKDLPAGTTYELRIYLKIKGGSAFIDMNHARAMLQGQGLVAVERFDGIIEIEDEFVPIEPHVDIVSITDSATITMQQPERIEIVDTFVPIAIPNMVVEITDTPRLTSTTVQYIRITEEGNVRVTEEGNTRLTEV